MKQHIAFFKLILRMFKYEQKYDCTEYFQPHFRDSRDIHDIYYRYVRKHFGLPWTKNTPQQNIAYVKSTSYGNV